MFTASVFALHKENPMVTIHGMLLVKIIVGNAKAYAPSLTSVADLTKRRDAPFDRVAPQHF
jgi:hypothetical protein